MHYDIFNGDADGICALHQLRLAEPQPEAELVTGVKRDISLLARLQRRAGGGDTLTVLDISMDSNKAALTDLLAQGCRVFYADHHFAGDLPPAPGLTAHIDPNPDTCTSLIIDRLLEGRYRHWAIVAAFGDNLHATAQQLAAEMHLDSAQTAMLRELGELLNYNGYGETVEDLHFSPDVLYQALHPYANPLDFFHDSRELAALRSGFAADMNAAHAHQPILEEACGRIYRFPAQAWSRRVAGVFSNEKARERPDLAHALVVDTGSDTVMVSVRAPLAKKRGADTLCRAFPTGGGRAAAAGINALPNDLLQEFMKQFFATFAG
ncbi:MAG: acetyltransferase [Desulfobulbaceae bacterium]|nr:acetyltransferase [Desulfobulbaceae bacterium]